MTDKLKKKPMGQHEWDRHFDAMVVGIWASIKDLKPGSDISLMTAHREIYAHCDIFMKDTIDQPVLTTSKSFIQALVGETLAERFVPVNAAIPSLLLMFQNWEEGQSTDLCPDEDTRRLFANIQATFKTCADPLSDPARVRSTMQQEEAVIKMKNKPVDQKEWDKYFDALVMKTWEQLKDVDQTNPLALDRARAAIEAASENFLEQTVVESTDVLEPLYRRMKIALDQSTRLAKHQFPMMAMVHLLNSFWIWEINNTGLQLHDWRWTSDPEDKTNFTTCLNVLRSRSTLLEALAREEQKRMNPTEQDGWEQYAISEKMSMSQHPLHYLFTNEKTADARKTWKAAIDFARKHPEAIFENVGLPMAQEPKYTIVGDHIVNRETGDIIPHDEPIFILRARDWYAANTIGYYADQVQIKQHKDAVNARHLQFSDWAETYPERMKQPDSAFPPVEGKQ